ncbi:MAG: tRNA lysidine(34) synthetase TilS [Desulfovibrionaceae bacterium]|jgi:tRNA(Ile)-lysidine synthase|nr:tRNA lysidine(34) synthetase TilS [Desulfovibrionaceae bacterium]
MIPATLQDLSPESARFCLGVEQFVRDELGLDTAGRTLVVGFSGGVDSTALLLTLRFLAPRLGITVRAAHLDHSLRPESASEAASARSVCRTLHIPLDMARVDVAALARERGAGLEETGRSARYAFFADLRRAQDEARSSASGGVSGYVPGGGDGAPWAGPGCLTALAHNRDDLAEDVLMRLMRGAGWPALGGMPALDLSRGLVRPLLATPRSAIQAFVDDCGLPYTRDVSNSDPAYFRNRVRMDILPRMVGENPQFLEAVGNLWRLARLDEAYFDAVLAGLWAGVEIIEEDEQDKGDSRKSSENVSTKSLRVPQAILAGQPPAVRLRLFKQCLERLGEGQALLAGLRGLDAAWARGAAGRVFQFPGPKEARVESDGVVFVRL